jgi:hypothetical protein
MIIPSGYAQIVAPFHHALLTRAAAIVYGVRVDVALGGPSDLADYIETIWESELQGMVDSNVSMGPFHASWNQGAGVLSGDGTQTFAGGLSDTTVAPNTAILISKTTSTPGRKGRGRMYFPWAATDASTNEAGQLDGAAVTAIQGLFDDWHQAHIDQDVPPVLLHTGVGTPSLIDAFTVQPLLATQRRRMRP